MKTRPQEFAALLRRVIECSLADFPSSESTATFSFKEHSALIHFLTHCFTSLVRPCVLYNVHVHLHIPLIYIVYSNRLSNQSTDVTFIALFSIWIGVGFDSRTSTAIHFASDLVFVAASMQIWYFLWVFLVASCSQIMCEYVLFT